MTVINCDMGEGFGLYMIGDDEGLMPLISVANVACGFHAADPMVIRKTLALAAAHDVAVGAHPSYHDLPGFGRRSIHHTPEEIEALMLYQLGALEGMCRSESLTLSYVKPHGALNNDMMRDNRLLRAVMEAVRTFRTDLPLMIPVTCNYRKHQQMAADVGLPLLLEAFADRAYDDEGQLVSRRQAGAVHEDPDIIVRQAKSFADKGGVFSTTGHWLELPADSLCVHGDNDAALDAIKAIRQALGKSGR